MRIVRYVLGGVVLGGLANACADAAGPAAPAADESASAGGGGGGIGVVTVPDRPRVPSRHRVAAEACDHERPPGSVTRLYDLAVPPDTETCATDADCSVPPSCDGCSVGCVSVGGEKRCLSARPGSCVRDADCRDGENGRCEDLRGARCTYDECFSDGECNPGGPCACEGGAGSSNACLLGNCRTDADCGGGGFCSPSFGGCGNYSGVIGYYCHTPEDTCIDDADCTQSDLGPGYCMYRPEVAHWVCGYGQCVG